MPDRRFRQSVVGPVSRRPDLGRGVHGIAVSRGALRPQATGLHRREAIRMHEGRPAAGPGQKQWVTVKNSVGFPACDADGLLRLHP